MSRELKALRGKIDALDRKILAGLAKRMRLVDAIGAYKRAHGMKALDAKRRDELKKTWVSRGRALALPASLVRAIFTAIHAHAVSAEKKLGA